jgi:uncharacterized protein
MRFFPKHERANLSPAEKIEPRTPLPVRMVASEEYLPVPETAQQREAEQRLYELAEGIAPRLGMSRRRFFQTPAAWRPPSPR